MRRNCAGIVCAIAVCSSARAQFVEPDAVVLRTFIGEASGDDFGWCIARLADIDHDGVADLAIGAPLNTAGGAGAGRAYVYSGRTGALIHTLTGDPGDGLGFCAADAGDCNNDGIHDIIVGAIPAFAAPPGAGAGRAYVFSGADGSVLHTLSGDAAGDFFGASVAGAGDVNADGFADVLIGAPNNSAQGAFAGRAYLYSGADGSLIRAYVGESAGDTCGGAVACIADIDGDGVREHCVSADRAGANHKGKVYVFSGRTGALIRTLLPDAATSVEFGGRFVSDAGDVNLDGFTDIFVGDFDDSFGNGKAFVFSGRDGSRLRAITGGVAGEGLGSGGAAGDVDADGRPDIIVGAFSNDTGANNGGRCAIFSGATGALRRTITGAVPGVFLGASAVGLGDVNADSRPDFLLSADGANRAYLIAGNRPTCVADLNGDGAVGSVDLARVISFWGLAGTADLDGSGVVGSSDLGLVLGAWGPCP